MFLVCVYLYLQIENPALIYAELDLAPGTATFHKTAEEAVTTYVSIDFAATARNVDTAKYSK
ncbi:hypothetical protein DPMN_111245 [Dreissena polymorpha]|uniref:Uncharacterized protein n=1 Tax=Dreissena polymorpha TaxID=45954 RepID=A0A9D4KE36_DREPO|nr:hypothetical protein DPMN_111245 [Dreissena polymorpha]